MGSPVGGGRICSPPDVTSSISDDVQPHELLENPNTTYAEAKVMWEELLLPLDFSDLSLQDYLNPNSGNPIEIFVKSTESINALFDVLSANGSSVSKLDFSGISFDNMTWMTLVGCLNWNFKMTSLVLMKCGVSGAQLDRLAHDGQSFLARCLTLDISCDEEASVAHAQSLNGVLRQCQNSIVDLHISICCRDSGVIQALFHDLTMSKLRLLSLPDNEMTDEIALHLTRYICPQSCAEQGEQPPKKKQKLSPPSFPSLEMLDLSDNKLTSLGFLGPIILDTSMSRVDVEGNNIRDDALTVLQILLPSDGNTKRTDQLDIIFQPQRSTIPADKVAEANKFLGQFKVELTELEDPEEGIEKQEVRLTGEEFDLYQEIEGVGSITGELIARVNAAVLMLRNEGNLPAAEVIYRAFLKKQFDFFEVYDDGDCLYHVINKLVSPEIITREMIVKDLRSRKEDVAPFLDTDFEEYCKGVLDGTMWGGDVEIESARRILARQIVVFDSRHAFELKNASLWPTGVQLNDVYQVNSGTLYLYFDQSKNHYCALKRREIKVTLEDRRLIEKITASAELTQELVSSVNDQVKILRSKGAEVAVLVINQKVIQHGFDIRNGAKCIYDVINGMLSTNVDVNTVRDMVVANLRARKEDGAFSFEGDFEVYCKKLAEGIGQLDENGIYSLAEVFQCQIVVYNLDHLLEFKEGRLLPEGMKIHPEYRFDGTTLYLCYDPTSNNYYPLSKK